MPKNPHAGDPSIQQRLELQRGQGVPQQGERDLDHVAGHDVGALAAMQILRTLLLVQAAVAALEPVLMQVPDPVVA